MVSTSLSMVATESLSLKRLLSKVEVAFKVTISNSIPTNTNPFLFFSISISAQFASITFY